MSSIYYNCFYMTGNNILCLCIDLSNFELQFDCPSFFSENTKNALICPIYIHLKRKEFAKFTTELPTVSARILLSGPSGTFFEIYGSWKWRLVSSAFAVNICSHFCYRFWHISGDIGKGTCQFFWFQVAYSWYKFITKCKCTIVFAYGCPDLLLVHFPMINFPWNFIVFRGCRSRIQMLTRMVYELRKYLVLLNIVLHTQMRCSRRSQLPVLKQILFPLLSLTLNPNQNRRHRLHHPRPTPSEKVSLSHFLPNSY